MPGRNVSYLQNGITKREARMILEKCRDKDFKDKERLMQCAKDTYEEIAEYIVESIVNKKSYEKISGKHYVPINKNDFYGCRRATICKYKNMLDQEV